MGIKCLLSIQLLTKEGRRARGFKNSTKFATCAVVGTKCWVWTGPDISGTFIRATRAYIMLTGATKGKRKWWTTFMRWSIQFNKVSIPNRKNKDPSSNKINWRILCALNVWNTSANEISLNWKISSPEVRNWLGYVLVVRTGCESEISSQYQKRKIEDRLRCKLTKLMLKYKSKMKPRLYWMKWWCRYKGKMIRFSYLKRW